MTSSPTATTPEHRVAIREDWGTAFTVEDDLFRIRLVNPRGSLLLNTYVYKSMNHFAVIDPGWPWTLDLLREAFRHLGLGRLSDVDTWLYTHTHVDHMGPAALLSRESDAEHVTYKGVEPFLDDWHAFQDDTNDWYEWSQTAFAEPARTMMRDWFAMRSASPEPDGMVQEFGREAVVQNARLLEFGDTIRVGDLDLEFVDGRGHDPYHGAFVSRDRSWLFSGDVVLATPTPISPSMGDDLDLYAQSLDRLQAIDAEILMPGHGAHRRGRSTRSFERSRAYLEGYRTQVLAALQEQTEPIDIYGLSLAMTPDGKPYDPLARWWVHLALVDSHIQWLVAAGKVERFDGPRYRNR